MQKDLFYAHGLENGLPKFKSLDGDINDKFASWVF